MLVSYLLLVGEIPLGTPHASSLFLAAKQQTEIFNVSTPKFDDEVSC
jgi:hypothetical protein